MNTSGLSRYQVKLMPHQANWAVLFANEAENIRGAIGDSSLRVEHVGSTAVPGIYAKPIIDIAIPYVEANKAKEYIDPLEKIGYIYKDEEGVSGRLFFVKGPEEMRTFYLHVVDNAEFDRLITFKEKLIHNTELAREYSELKIKLAEQFPENRKSYTKSKDKFISDILYSQ